MSKNICIVAGARPNFVKVAPLIRAIEKAEGAEYELVYTGREDDPTLESSLFDDLQMRRPDVYLGVDCVSLNELTGRVMGEFERYLENHPTDVVKLHQHVEVKVVDVDLRRHRIALSMK